MLSVNFTELHLFLMILKIGDYMFFQRGHMTAIAGIVATSIAINSVAPAHAKPSVTDQINTAETSLDRASKSIANIENLPDVAEVERQIAEKHKEITDVEKQKNVCGRRRRSSRQRSGQTEKRS